MLVFKYSSTPFHIVVSWLLLILLLMGYCCQKLKMSFKPDRGFKVSTALSKLKKKA